MLLAKPDNLITELVAVESADGVGGAGPEGAPSPRPVRQPRWLGRPSRLPGGAACCGSRGRRPSQHAGPYRSGHGQLPASVTHSRSA